MRAQDDLDLAVNQDIPLDGAAEARAPSTFRDPSYTWRVALVAAVYMVPGWMAGAIAGIFFGFDFWLCSTLGAMLSGLLGGWLEAR